MNLSEATCLTSMQTEPPDTFIDANRDELKREIESLAQLIRGADQKSGESEQSLAVIRIFNGLEPEVWRDYAERHGLQDWFALALDGNRFPLLSRLQAMIRELAYRGDHDPMTGLLNRRAFESRVGSELERAKRNHQSVTLAIIDLDNFKAVNDVYGHPVGDEVLNALSRTLVDITRRYDVAARIGGEEFALFLPDAGLTKARATVNRVLESVRDLKFTAPDGTEFKVTCSVGVACWKAKSTNLTPDLYEIADQALYEAKRAGKDRMHVSMASEHTEKRPDSRVRSAEKRFLFTGS